jgi:hypothetical protein
MSTPILRHPWVTAIEGAFAHIAAVIIGFLLMVIGLGMGVTMVMLPVGIVLGLLGTAILVGGLFGRIEK